MFKVHVHLLFYKFGLNFLIRDISPGLNITYSAYTDLSHHYSEYKFELYCFFSEKKRTKKLQINWRLH